MLINFNKFIQSSISMAFLALIGWAVSYCYGWGQALFHGYPWLHVDKGMSAMARSMTYVMAVSALLVLCYMLAYYLLKQMQKITFSSQLGWLRIIVLVSVFTLPSFITFHIFTHRIPLGFAISCGQYCHFNMVVSQTLEYLYSALEFLERVVTT